MGFWVHPLLAEVIGTFALIFMGAGAIIMTQGTNLVAIAFAHGLAIALMVAAAGHISGGAYNPAVTIGLGVGRKLPWPKVVAYIIAQLVGATLAALVLKSVFPSDLTAPVGLGTPAVGEGYSNSNALIAEIITTFFLMYVIYGVAVDKRGPASIAALCIGLTISMDIFATGAVSGAAMNPARWFGPALVEGQWENGWIWIVGPVVGALIAAGVYFYVYHRGKDQATAEPTLRAN
jgi:aquaporin TIP